MTITADTRTDNPFSFDNDVIARMKEFMANRPPGTPGPAGHARPPEVMAADLAARGLAMPQATPTRAPLASMGAATDPRATTWSWSQAARQSRPTNADLELPRTELLELFGQQDSAALVYHMYKQDGKRYRMMVLHEAADGDLRRAVHWFVYDLKTEMYVDVYGSADRPRDILARLKHVHPVDPQFGLLDENAFLGLLHSSYQEGSTGPLRAGWADRANTAVKTFAYLR